MRSLTATQASRQFAALLDAVQQGESVAVARAGHRIAVVGPVNAPNGAALAVLMQRVLPDPGFGEVAELYRSVDAADAHSRQRQRVPGVERLLGRRAADAVVVPRQASNL
ncbi:MAG TPA: type II toxin-antitoxin system prevent-host-death family antitoxin [Frankiaceae bacterium]